MTGFTGVYSDGRHSARHPVRVRVDPTGRVHVEGLAAERRYAIAEVRVSDRVGSIARTLYLPDGGCIQTHDNDAVDAVVRRHARGVIPRLVYRMESHLGHVAAALVIGVAVVWGFIDLGIPALAGWAARAIPVATERSLGDEALRSLDLAWLRPTELAAADRGRISGTFRDLCTGAPGIERCRLIFRTGGPVGANALALPHGIVVLTDELVRLAEDERELAAVLAHELGHLSHRHTMRSILQDSMAALLVIAITGDLSSTTSLAGALPAYLVEARFSRQFEREADRYAIRLLERRGISLGHLAAILLRLEEAHGGEEGMSLLSTHPLTRERVEAVEGARQRAP